MFNLLGEAAPFLEKCSITCTVSEKNGVISFTIVPKTKEGKDMKIQPLTVSGTLNELDTRLPIDFKKAFGDNVDIISNVAEVLDSVKAASEKASGKTTTTKTSTPAASAPAKKDEPVKPVYTKAQKDVIKKVEAEIEKRKKDTDPEKRAYVRKQLKATLTGAQLDSLVTELLDKELPALKDEGDLFSNNEPAPAAAEKEAAKPEKDVTQAKAKANSPSTTKPEGTSEAPPLVAESNEIEMEQSDVNTEDADNEEDTDNPDADLQDDAKEAEPEPIKTTTAAAPANTDGWL